MDLFKSHKPCSQELTTTKPLTTRLREKARAVHAQQLLIRHMREIPGKDALNLCRIDLQPAHGLECKHLLRPVPRAARLVHHVVLLHVVQRHELDTHINVGKRTNVPGSKLRKCTVRLAQILVGLLHLRQEGGRQLLLLLSPLLMQRGLLVGDHEPQQRRNQVVRVAVRLLGEIVRALLRYDQGHRRTRQRRHVHADLLVEGRQGDPFLAGHLVLILISAKSKCRQ